MIYVLIHDRQKQNENYKPRTFYKKEEEIFKKLNQEKWGVYFCVNSFEATPEQLKKHNKKTKRNIEFLTKLNYVFADLDIAKAGDNQTREQKEEKKEILLLNLYEICPPTAIIDTSNGVQPLWKINESKTDITTQQRYSNLINAISLWSKQSYGKGDKVKDVTRVLRLPNYFHQKEEPYLVKMKYYDKNKVYTIEELENKFKEYINLLPDPKKDYKPKQTNKQFKLDDISRKIEAIDIKDVVVRAFNSIGRQAEFDKDNRLILDNRLTGTFQGKNGDMQYIATTSHEPFQGNKITVTADIKQITNKEARKWIIEEFNLREKAPEIKPKPIIVKLQKNHYSWGTKELNESFGIIKNTTYTIIGGGYGVGKTPFCINMALDNVKLGHKVLYLSLEMDTEEILDFLARKKAGITVPEELYNTIPDYKKENYKIRIEELRKMENFVLKGVRSGTAVNWESLKNLINEDCDMLFIDNFNLIQKEDGNLQYEHEGDLSHKFLGYTQDRQIPINVIHHYSKGGARETQKTGYSLSGNAKIMNDAQRIILLDRKQFSEEDNPTLKDKAMLRVTIDKARGYDRGITKVVYHYHGGFVDYWYEDVPNFYEKKESDTLPF